MQRYPVVLKNTINIQRDITLQPSKWGLLFWSCCFFQILLDHGPDFVLCVSKIIMSTMNIKSRFIGNAEILTFDSVLNIKKYIYI